MTRTLSAVPLAFALLTGCAATGGHRGGHLGPALSATIRATGEGRVTAEPDVAVLAIGVEALAKALPDASRDADQRMRRVVAALEGAGVQKRDVRTTRYDVNMERRFDPKLGTPGEIVGYRVVHELRVVVRDRDPARAGTALDAALRAGANLVHSLSFEREDATAERSRALALAIEAARAKAEVMAKAAGVSLGAVREVSEAGGGGVPVVRTMKMATMAAEAAPFQGGDLEFTANVDVVFGIQ
ncbi:MAG TPA: SIMPL domain-containing protein [Anaeromyxobacteraceae bacterium]|nr:SIMPL domain-containing protein [Anaeromyxobacteraceae bacterium]